MRDPGDDAYVAGRNAFDAGALGEIVEHFYSYEDLEEMFMHEWEGR
jgi:hypothetical protein